MLREWPAIQIGSVFYLQLIYQIYLIKVKPYSPSGNYLTMFNELMHSLYLLPCYLLTDNVNDVWVRDKAAWSMLSITTLTACVHITLMLISVIMHFKIKITSYLNRNRTSVSKYVVQGDLTG